MGIARPIRHDREAAEPAGIHHDAFEQHPSVGLVSVALSLEDEAQAVGCLLLAITVLRGQFLERHVFHVSGDEEM